MFNFSIEVFAAEINNDISDKSTAFTDVSTNTWYSYDVNYLAEKGIINGVSKTHFEPNRMMTRAEFATIIAALSKEDLTKYGGDTKFIDVPNNAWYAKNIQWATDSGIVYGRSDTSFEPESNITREEAIVIVDRYATLFAKREIIKTTNSFTFNDLSEASSWSLSSIKNLQEGYILRGDNFGNLFPKDFATRAEISTMLCSYIMVDDQQKIYLKMDEIDREMDEEIANYYEKVDEIKGDYSLLSGFVYAGFQFLDGDILVTNDTMKDGIFGHAGMVVGSNVMEIMPASQNTPRLISLSTWKSRYGKDTTVILRRIPAYNGGNQNCRNVSVNAAWYALQYYINGSGRYVTYNKYAQTWSTSTAQCATLVYRAYSNGAGFIFEKYHYSGNYGYWGAPSEIYPYDFIDNRVHNGFSAIARF